MTVEVVTTCESCGATFDAELGRIRHKAVSPAPDLETLEEWDADAGCEATDGCWVEADGHCEHGHQSWMLRLGLI